MEKLAFFVCFSKKKKSFICAFYSHRRPVWFGATRSFPRRLTGRSCFAKAQWVGQNIPSLSLRSSDPTKHNYSIIRCNQKKVLRSTFDVRDWTTFINSVINTLHPFCVQWLSNENTDTTPKGVYELHRHMKGEFWREWMTSPILKCVLFEESPKIL